MIHNFLRKLVDVNLDVYCVNNHVRRTQITQNSFEI